MVMLIHLQNKDFDESADKSFQQVQNKILNTFKNEKVYFSDILICRDFLRYQKLISGIFQTYMSEEYDLKNSYIIGSRERDIHLAHSLNSRVILLSKKTLENVTYLTPNWDDVYRYLWFPPRIAEVGRKTGETNIAIRLDLDGHGKADIETGLGFFDHMLQQIARHSGCDLQIRVEGDLAVDEHHTIEDTALALGEAFDQALGDKRGIERYGFVLPMDDSLAQVAVDFSGRNWIEWEVKFSREKIGEMPTEMFYHFFKSFSDAARCNLHIQAKGTNEHHKIEAIFKAVGKSIGQAIGRSASHQNVPSTKGIL
jgi:imidazoleglycerol-phosphate dehydratase/histidinol-phosphatase